MLLSTLFGMFPFLQKLFADSAYQGPLFNSDLAKILPCLKTEIVKRSDHAKGFVVLPKRWIVERTIAWLNVSGMRFHVGRSHASRRWRVGIQYWRMASTAAGMSVYALRRNALPSGPFLVGPSRGCP